MPRVNTVQKARKDYPDEGISKGDKYYWWKFPYGSKVKSLTYPKCSQLTRSSYKAQAYDIDDSIQAMEDPEDLSMYTDEIEALKDETHSKYRLEEILEEIKGVGCPL